MFGGICYTVGGKMFAALMEDAVGVKLPDEQRGRALTLEGESQFRPSTSRAPFEQRVQFVLAMEEHVVNVLP